VLHGEDEDPPAQVTHFLDVLTPFFPGPHPTGDECVHLLAPLAHADVRSGLGSIDDDVWVEVGQRAISVSAVEGVVHSAHDFDVFLRHRPLSISRRQ
jgi:hypothetical protein